MIIQKNIWIYFEKWIYLNTTNLENIKINEGACTVVRVNNCPIRWRPLIHMTSL